MEVEISIQTEYRSLRGRNRMEAEKIDSFLQPQI